MSSFQWPPQGSAGGVTIYTNLAAFPVSATTGDLGVAADTGIIYEWRGSSWVVVGGPGAALSIGTIDTGTPSANGAQILANALIMQSASASLPGVVNNTSQTLSGTKTFSSAPILSSLSASLPLQLDGSKNIISSAIDLSGSQATGILAAGRFPALTGDVTTSAGALATTIGANKVANSQLAQMAANSIKGNNTGSTANALDLTVAQVNTLLGTILANGTVAFSADQSMGSHKLTSVTDPSSAQDAATKNYVDTALAALNPADAVFAASTATIAGTYLNGVAGVGATFTTTATGVFTIDGVTPALSARILLKDQSSGLQNGVYNITTLGAIGISTVFTRALDYNTASEMNSAGLIPVINGTVNALSSWQQVATITTVGTDALVFTEFTANPSLYLLKANNLSDVANSTTSFNNISGLTTLGDTLYGGASGTRTRLAGNITTTKKFLTQTGDGANSAAPAWNTIANTDLSGITNTQLSGSAAITNANLASMATLTIKGNNTGGGSTPLDLTVAQVNTMLGTLSNPMTTGGDIIYGGSSGTPTRLANGTANQVLTSAGGTAAPTWKVPAPTFTVVSKTGTYSAVINDYIVASSTSFTITLPDATTAGNSGEGIVIEHNGTSLTQVYTLNTTSSQTINGPGGTVASGAYALYTTGEVVYVVSDGSNWQVKDHKTSTAEADAGALALTASSGYVFTLAASASITIGTVYTSNGNTFYVSATSASSTTLNCYGTGSPGASGTLTFVSGSPSGNKTFNSVSTGTQAKGASTYEKFVWQRDSNRINFRWDMKVAAGTAGTGDYGFFFPANLLPDVTNMQTSLAVLGATLTSAITFSTIGNGFLSSSAAGNATAFVGNSAIMKIIFTGNGAWAGGNAGNLGNASSISIQGSYPVTNWQP